jgi:aryl-alcohol dehydrogenase-like predicted oxidoreductase
MNAIMHAMESRFVVGTANFGRQYGTVQPYSLKPLEIEEISKVMETISLNKIDTAFSYSLHNSDLEVDPSFFAGRQVTTKVSLRNFTESYSSKSIRECFIQDLEKKRIQKYENVLFHDSDDLKLPRGLELLEVISQLKEEGLTNGVGVSVYTAKEVDDVLLIMDPDVIQVPVNLFDQRLLDTGHLAQLAYRNVKIQVRSIFLQGLLLQKEFEFGSRAFFAKKYLDKWWEFLNEEKINPLNLCLDFILTNGLFDEVVVGVNNSDQLQDIVFYQPQKEPFNFSQFALTDENILDPRKWKS